MTRPRHRARTPRRTRSWLLPLIAGGLAVLVTSLLSPVGTSAAWSDFAPIRSDAVIRAGGPNFTVTGFEQLSEHDYADDDNLTSAPATIEVTNTGDVKLQHFEASVQRRQDEGGNPDFYDSVSWSFTRAGANGTDEEDWDGWAAWLYDLALEPDESATYQATTTLDPDAFELQDDFAVFEITVLTKISSSWATADTAWSLVTGVGIVQYVTYRPTLPIDLDTSNARWEGDVLHGYDLHLVWDNPNRPFGDTYTVSVNGIAQISETYLYWSPRYQIGPDRVWATFAQSGRLKDAPGTGQTVAITVEVRVSGDPTWVARKTLWATRSGNSVLIYGVDPTTPQRASAPAPVMTFSAPAPAQAPQAAQAADLETSPQQATPQPVVPEAAPQPSTSQPAVPQPATPAPEPEVIAPAPTPETRPDVGEPGLESEPEGTEPAPDAEPAGTAPRPEAVPEALLPEQAPEPPAAEVTVEDEAAEPLTLIELDGDSADTIEGATVGDEQIEVEPADGGVKLALPEQFWSGPREVVLTGKRDGEVFTLTIRLDKGESGEITYELVEPEEAPSKEGSI
ncbi:hypothetical protein GCM10022288_23680 [Gryllotalpicola kribbensis]|uniref:Uncharacterized protein n=1 Tax=Gryllotalpicola kribbensis TaxID=993084 RepID=A0ABP8AWH5_9MICO